MSSKDREWGLDGLARFFFDFGWSGKGEKGVGLGIVVTFIVIYCEVNVYADSVDGRLVVLR